MRYISFFDSDCPTALFPYKSYNAKSVTKTLHNDFWEKYILEQLAYYRFKNINISEEALQLCLEFGTLRYSVRDTVEQIRAKYP